MQLVPWDPDIQTLIKRISSGDLNLQPDFQRGEVWGPPKRRRLIDTILRGWHVPPVHVVVDRESELYEVLDGQQRLAAIRDFVANEVAVDGKTPPHDDEILSLDGLTYSELPERIRRRFDNYSLRVIRITEYKPEEPGELFYRLNQPTSLTAAEQRNAFYGRARGQVKDLARLLPELGVTADTVGFTNSRLAYDDIVARVCYAHHVGTLREKITAGVVTSLYRSDTEFSDSAIERTQAALSLFGAASRLHDNMKYNKATLFSWLVFLSALQKREAGIHANAISDYMLAFEDARLRARDPHAGSRLSDALAAIPADNQRQLLAMYNDRATSRVADVASVLYRDAILWLFFSVFCEASRGAVPCPSDGLGSLHEIVPLLSVERADAAQVVEQLLADTSWGSYL